MATNDKELNIKQRIIILLFIMVVRILKPAEYDHYISDEIDKIKNELGYKM